MSAAFWLSPCRRHACLYKQKRPVRFFQTGRFEIKRIEVFSDYGAGYKIAFTAGSIQLFATTGTKISASAA